MGGKKYFFFLYLTGSSVLQSLIIISYCHSNLLLIKEIYIIYFFFFQNLLSQIPKVTLFDAASKYGTFINKDIESNRCVSKKTPHELSNGDQIRFGFQWNKFKQVFFIEIDNKI